MTPPRQRSETPLRSPEERAWVERARAGDREAFGRLVQLHAGTARRLARAVLRSAEDADDAVQDGCVAAWVHRERFDPTRPFGPWLLRIVLNQAHDRRRRRTVRKTEELDPGHPDPGPDPERELERERLRGRVREVLEELPTRRRIAVLLYDAEGYSHAEIAEVLKVPVGTVRSDVFQARRRLRNLLADWNQLEGG